jgi:hypothetical protein
MTSHSLLRVAAAALAACAVLLPQSPRERFVIQVVDEATGRGVPLVELKTVANVSSYTDSNGIVAFSEPGLMGQRIFFFIQSDGYEYPKDGFGYRGKAFDVKPGGSAVVKLKRLDIAERLYRVTGEGIYRDTVLAGRKPPVDHPLLNGKVTGSDGVQTALYRGKLYWFWGDTGGLDYPLGNFSATGAISDLPGQGGLDPAVGVNLRYFTRPDGFVKPMFDLPGDGPKWLSGLMVVKDHSGKERLLAGYQVIGDQMASKEVGLAAFDDDALVFRKLAEFPLSTRVRPDGRPFKVRSGGEDYYYMFTLTSLPWIRVKADWDQIQDLGNYETYSCYQPRPGNELERDPSGNLVCGWKKHTDLMLWDEQKALVATGKLKPGESLWQVRDFDTGQPIEVRMGTVYWSRYRNRWIAILQRPGNAVYFAEADTPVGPWVYAKKIVEFERYTFYWPAQHPYFDQRDGRTIYFEGTYTAAFSSAPFQTPRYDYNQLLYRLNLEDPRLDLPVAVYRLKGGALQNGDAIRDWSAVESIAFFALRGDSKFAKTWPNPYAILPLDRGTRE